MGQNCDKFSFEAINGIAPGDKVKVVCGEQEFKRLQKGHGGWVDDLAQCIGRQLILECFDKDGDARVFYEGRSFCVNTKVLQSVPELEVEFAVGDRIKVSGESLKGVHWVDPQGEVDNAILKQGGHGIVYEIDGPFLLAAIKLANDRVYRINCLSESVRWIRQGSMETGDEVELFHQKETVMKMQEGHGEYVDTMEMFLGATGFLTTYHKGLSWKVDFSIDGSVVNFMVNQCLLEKTSVDLNFIPGDRVKIIEDAHRFEVNQKFHGGFSESLRRFIGKIGIVNHSQQTQSEDHSKGDLALRFFGEEGLLIVNPRSVQAHHEVFNVGAKVAFLTDPSRLIRCEQRTSSYSMQEMESRQFQVGTVVRTSGEGPMTVVSVEYNDKRQINLISGHLVKAEKTTETVLPCAMRKTNQNMVVRGSGLNVMEPRNGFAPGDYVTCCVDQKTLEVMQHGNGGWTDRMKLIMGSVSVIKGFNLRGGVVISTKVGRDKFDEWHVYGGALKKIENPPLLEGDLIEVVQTARAAMPSEEVGLKGIILNFVNHDNIEVVLRRPNNEVFKKAFRREQLKRSSQPVLFVGDSVMCYSDETLIRKLQQKVKLSTANNVSLILNKRGTVAKFNALIDAGVKFSLSNESESSVVLLNSRLLFKIDAPQRRFRLTDKVKVTDNLSRLRALQEGHGGFKELMTQLLGKTGNVVRIFENSAEGHVENDILVVFFTHGLKQVCVFNPDCIEESEDVFAEGDKVCCLIVEPLMRAVLPPGHFMQGLNFVQGKIFKPGKVTNVAGEGNYALVDVKYEDGTLITYFSKHLVQMPDLDMGDMVEDFLEKLAGMMTSAEKDQIQEQNVAARNSTVPAKAERECPICLESDRQWVCFGCGHVLCHQCADEIVNDSKRCPMCNGLADRVTKLYF